MFIAIVCLFLATRSFDLLLTCVEKSDVLVHYFTSFANGLAYQLANDLSSIFQVFLNEYLKQKMSQQVMAGACRSLVYHKCNRVMRNTFRATWSRRHSSRRISLHSGIFVGVALSASGYVFDNDSL